MRHLAATGFRSFTSRLRSGCRLRIVIYGSYGMQFSGPFLRAPSLKQEMALFSDMAQ